MFEFTNEILFALFLFGGLILALGSSYFGKAYIYALIIAITIYINIAEAKVIDVLGFSTTLGTALFGVMYFATDLLTERYGKSAGYTAVKLGIFSAICFQIFMQLTLLATAITGDDFISGFSAAMDTVFTTSLRIVGAGLFVYMLSQTLDIYLFQRIKDMTGEKYLWLRNNASTFVSQAFDTFAFTFLAFYGSMPTAVVLEIATVGYIFKLVVAVFDTPFIYASRLFKPHDLN